MKGRKAFKVANSVRYVTRESRRDPIINVVQAQRRQLIISLPLYPKMYRRNFP